MKRYLVLLAIAGCAAVTPGFADNCPTTASWCSGLYLYDGSGNIRAIGSDTYIYDKLGRLKSGTAEAQRGGTSRQDYTYDSFGNRTGASRAAGSVDCLGGCEESPAIDLGTNHITGSGAAYDAAGNLLSIQSTVNGTTFSSTYAYDAAGMTRATAGTDDRQFIYDADGERIGTRNGQTWTWTVRGLDDKVLREFSSLEPNGQPGLPSTNRQLTKDYVWRSGQLLASVTAASGATTIQHFHLDHLGTPRLVTNDIGVQIGIHAYYPFGAELNFGPDSPAGELLKFTGHERDLVAGSPNTLDYMHARYDASIMGRFMSVDPLIGSSRRPQTWNRYAYANSNPIRYVDPTGMGFVDWIKNLFGLSDGSDPKFTVYAEITVESTPLPLSSFDRFQIDMWRALAAPPEAMLRAAGEHDHIGFSSAYWQVTLAPFTFVGGGEGGGSGGFEEISSEAVLEDAGATGFRGSEGFELSNAQFQPTRNAPGEVNGTLYSGHAFDQMQNRGMTPSVVENARTTGEAFPGKDNAVGYYDAVNNIRVFVDKDTGRVITVMRGAPK